MTSKLNQHDRPRRLARRAHREHPWLSRAALSRTAVALTAQGKLTGDDDRDVLIVATAVEATSVHRRSLSDAWLDPAQWPSPAPLVHLHLTCADDETLAEEWVLPAPEAALVAANWALRLALQPQHDDLRGELDAASPLLLWDGRVDFSPAQPGASLTAWAIDFDPHARAEVVDLPTAFHRIGRDLRRRMARKTGPLLAPLRGEPLTIDAAGWGPLDADRDPDEPDPDHVGGWVTAVVDGDRVPDNYDDLMVAVKAVGHYVASAFDGPGSLRDETCPGVPPQPGRVEFSWYVTHSSLLAELKDDDDV